MDNVTLEKFYTPNFKTVKIADLLKNVELFIYHSECFEYRVNNNRRGKIIYHEWTAKEEGGDKYITKRDIDKNEYPYKNDYYINKGDFEKILQYIKENNIRTCYNYEIYGV